jgi:hypothetical protein
VGSLDSHCEEQEQGRMLHREKLSGRILKLGRPFRAVLHWVECGGVFIYCICQSLAVATLGTEQAEAGSSLQLG